jgi:hypothetical protein
VAKKYGIGIVLIFPLISTPVLTGLGKIPGKVFEIEHRF